MITIWKQVTPESWELVEELQDDLALAQRILELRAQGEQARAEKKNELGSEILDC